MELLLFFNLPLLFLQSLMLFGHLRFKYLLLCTVFGVKKIFQFETKCTLVFRSVTSLLSFLLLLVGVISLHSKVDSDYPITFLNRSSMLIEDRFIRECGCGSPVLKWLPWPLPTDIGGWIPSHYLLNGLVVGNWFVLRINHWRFAVFIFAYISWFYN